MGSVSKASSANLTNVRMFDGSIYLKNSSCCKQVKETFDPKKDQMSTF